MTPRTVAGRELLATLMTLESRWCLTSEEDEAEAEHAAAIIAIENEAIKNPPPGWVLAVCMGTDCDHQHYTAREAKR